MSNFLPDYTSVNTVLATVSNPQVLTIYARRAAIVVLGLVMFWAGFALLVAGSSAGKAAVGGSVRVGEAVATKGGSEIARTALNKAKNVG